jgi:hypothetical protein
MAEGEVEGLEIGMTYQNIKGAVGAICNCSESYNFAANIRDEFAVVIIREYTE